MKTAEKLVRSTAGFVWLFDFQGQHVSVSLPQHHKYSA